jgi:LDH2 family malate/lactate/ureidoglycolate dehydrogenase
VIDPDLFGGRSAFARQTGHLAEACRASRPAPGAARVRLPGENGLARKRKALTEGVTLRPSIVEGLQPWAQKLGIPPLS